MGSVCSTPCTAGHMVLRGSFEMPGVSANVLEETWRDIEAAPLFVPHLLEVKLVRGEPTQVGACWLERRRIGRPKQPQNYLIVRKTITHRTDNPFQQCALTELVESTTRSMPDFVATYTLTILPLAKDDDRSCCVHTSDAIVARGIGAKIVACLCFSCLKRLWMDQVQDEWQYYYCEALRRTAQKNAAQQAESSDDATTAESPPIIKAKEDTFKIVNI